jgi:hypothetical protein
MRSSPASGTPRRPVISTGCPGSASVSCLPEGSRMLRTLPHSVPMATLSPTCAWVARSQ